MGERLNVAFSYAESGQGTLGKLMYDEELYNRMLALVDDVREHPWKLMVRPRQTPNSGKP